MQKNTLLPGDSTVVELIFNTKSGKGLSPKNATIETNDTTQVKLAIDFKANIIPSPDTVSMVRFLPENLQFALGSGKQQVVKIKNYGATAVRLSPVGAVKDGMNVAIENQQIAPGGEGNIIFDWAGGALEQGIKHVATFSTTDQTIPLFSIPYVVEGTEPFPVEHAPDPISVTPTTAQPSDTKHVHNKPDSLNPMPIQIDPGSNSGMIQSAPAPVTAPGMNPPHGQPNHRCDISVGAPLNSPSGVGLTPPTASTALGMNPPHGQPNHRCDIAVGAPLNSAPAKHVQNKPDLLNPKSVQITPVPKPDTPQR